MGPAVAAPPSPKGMPVEMPGPQEAARWALRAGNVGLGQPFPAQDSLSGKAW